MPTRMLAVDTASEICGVALAVDGMVRVELIVNHGGTHTKTVMDAIKAVVDTAKLTISQIDVFAVSRGPGSFTGLRIGISTIKGLATAMNRPMVGVCSLDVLARQAPEGTPLVCSLMDARRNEVYWRLYARKAQGLTALVPPQVGPADGIVSHIDETCLMIGNGAQAYRQTLDPFLRERAHWMAEDDNGLRPEKLAKLAWAEYRRGKTRDADVFTPLYLRKSDAELNRKQL